MASKPKPPAPEPAPPQDPQAMTAAEAAKRVGIQPAELLAFRDYGTRLVVVTIAGKKLVSEGAK